MNLYYCRANGPIGPFGDYIYADSKAEAERQFRKDHGCWPTYTTFERRVKR